MTTALSRTELPHSQTLAHALRAGLAGTAATLALAVGAATTLAFACGPAAAQVGYTQIELQGLPVTLVYPTEAKAAPLRIGAFEIEVAVDAPLATAASANGQPLKRPLIVTSHGTGGSPIPDHGIAAALARAGFVVAQPLHAGDNYRDMSKAGPDAFRTRPLEVVRVIDALAAHPRWGTALRFDRVGVHGTSAGGVTALSLAGAQWRLLALLQHCQAHLEEDLGFCFNGAPDAARQATRRAQYESVRGVPERFLPAALTDWQGGRTVAAGDGADPRPDARIAAVSLSVPVAAIFSPESLARVRIPVGLVAAQADEMLVPRFHSGHVQRHCARCTVLADLPGASHFDVMQPWPAEASEIVARQTPRGTATQPAFDARLRAEAYARVVQFHLQHVAQAATAP
jgi:predicted dienelactone hydrolase